MSHSIIQYFKKPELVTQAQSLYRRGGGFKRAGEKVLSIVTLITSNERNPLKDLKITNHGETRIDKCVKYDLTSACRLVTVQDKNKIILLFVGDHNEVDKWLDRNKGKRFVTDENGRIEEIHTISEKIDEYSKHEFNHEYSPGKLYELLPEDVFDELVVGCGRSHIRSIELLHCFSTDDEVFEAAELFDDEGKKNLFLDILILLRENKPDEAIKRIAYDKKLLHDLTDDHVSATESIYSIPTDDPTYAELFSHFIKTADYKQWMLFMHPEQQTIVDLDFKGSAKLLGVSGSGKTCVVVKRAVRLAKKYPGEEILIVTLNRSLSRLIKELVDVVCLNEVSNRVHVKPFFKVCQEHLHCLEPGSDKLYDDTTWKSHEHIDEIWSEFYRCKLNNHDAEVLIPVHDYLIAQGINAEEYIREEFDWIRSAFSQNTRDSYLKIDREGRSIPMSKKHRILLLKGLEKWETKMKMVGITDYIGLASALSKHSNSLNKKYRCTLVDESQDFGTTELGIIRNITYEGENDIFICGDAAQRVSTKFQSLKASGIYIPSSRSKKLFLNYRNSKEILNAAYSIFDNYISDNDFSGSEDFEVLPPEFSRFSGPAPLILHTDSLDMELAFAQMHAKIQIKENPSWKVCIAFCGYSLYEVKKFGNTHNLSVLDGETSLGDNSIFISDLEQAKGFEFDMMIVVNTSKDIIPNPSLPEKEHYRELCHLYVALTRAKSELVVSYHGTPSKILNDDCSNFIHAKWIDYISNGEIHPIRPPQKINEIYNIESKDENILFLTGPEFLYSTSAIGLSSLLIPKLRDLISGNSLNREGHRVKWKNIGSAYDSIRTSPRSRAAFGPEGAKEFRYLCEELDIPDLLRSIKKKELYEYEI